MDGEIGAVELGCVRVGLWLSLYSKDMVQYDVVIPGPLGQYNLPYMRRWKHPTKSRNDVCYRKCLSSDVVCRMSVK